MNEKKIGNQSIDSDKDKGFLEKLEEDVKSSVFNVLFEIIKNDDTTFWKFLLMLTISYFQLLNFSFHEGVTITF